MEGLGRILRTQGADETKTERPKLFGESTWERTALSYQIGHNLLIQRLCILIGVCLGYALYRSSPVGDAKRAGHRSLRKRSLPRKFANPSRPPSQARAHALGSVFPIFGFGLS